LALVVLSVVEQRLDAARAVLGGGSVVDVADRVGVARSTLHRWIGRYLVESVAGLADRSHRPASCPHQVATMVEVVVAEMRRKHPRWGSKRIRMELLRKPVVGVVVPSERTIARILLRQGWRCLGLGSGPGSPMSAGSSRVRCSCGGSTSLAASGS